MKYAVVLALLVGCGLLASSVGAGAAVAGGALTRGVRLAAADAVPVLAETPTAADAVPVVPAAAVTPAPLERTDLEAYFDGFFPFALQRSDIAGAVVVVVKDGQTLFQKGYGLADVKKGQPVDPQTTLFRPGSISKLFTWTAVMQLVEAGKLDLDRDVNTYLDFRIPATFSQPITLRHLLTHTPGFEDTFKNLLVTDVRKTHSLEEFVKTALPPRMFPPGTVVAYSNYGATLAGYIVQRVSGERFEDYIQRHIFAPLQMTHSTFLQPAPASFGGGGPTGYKVASGPPVPFEFIGTMPAGALTTTAPDMAHFMIAHLQDGQFAAGEILQPTTARLMHAPAYRAVAPLQALSLGFYGEDRNGHRVIGHAGDLISFHADLHLLLDDHVGVFVALNSLGKEVASSAVRAVLFEGFMDRYFPAPVPREPTLATALEHGKRLVGEYQPSRRVQSGFAAIGNLFEVGKLTVNDDATVTMSTLKGYNGEPKRWREVAPFVWREVNGTARLAAAFDGGVGGTAGGSVGGARVRFLSSDNLPPVAVWQPVPGIYAASWNLPLLGATLFILAVTVLAWPVAALVRRYYGRTLTLQGPARRLYRLTRGVALLDLIFLGGWLAFLIRGSDDLNLLSDASDPLLRLLEIIGLAGLVGLALVLSRLGQVFRDPGSRWWGRLTSCALALACLATAWFGCAFHLWSLNLRY